MDQITIKTPNSKCRLSWCLIEFIDWGYSQSCWYFRPSCKQAPLSSHWLNSGKYLISAICCVENIFFLYVRTSSGLIYSMLHPFYRKQKDSFTFALNCKNTKDSNSKKFTFLYMLFYFHLNFFVFCSGTTSSDDDRCGAPTGRSLAGLLAEPADRRAGTPPDGRPVPP